MKITVVWDGKIFKWLSGWLEGVVYREDRNKLRYSVSGGCGDFWRLFFFFMYNLIFFIDFRYCLGLVNMG